MKHRHYKLVCLIISLAFATCLAAQGSPELYRVVKTSNGQSFLLNSKAGGSAIYTDVSFRMGPIYEFDSVSGISMLLSHIISARIDDALRSGSHSVKYKATVEPEQIAFHFESGIADLDYVLNLVNDKVIQPKFDEEGVEEAKTAYHSDMDSLMNLTSFRTDNRVMNAVWGHDYKKLNNYGDWLTYKRIRANDLTEFHKHYFLPFNNSIVVSGTYNENEVLEKLQNTFKDFRSREFNPELITKVIDFKPVINTIQLISPAAGPSLATITFQNPGARQDRNATYCANILTQLINDKDGTIQKTMKMAGLKDFKATYTESNFYGIFVLSAQPSGDHFADAFRLMSQLIADITKKDYFIPADFEKAQKDIEAEYKDLRVSDPHAYMTMVAQYRFSNDENYFSAFADSIKGVTIDHMRRYVTEYFTDHAGVRNLIASAEAIKNAAPDQQYFPMDESISEIKFTYDLNKSDIETDEAKQNLKMIIQWLKINSDIHVQINGCSDKGEFTKAYNDTVMKFIDSTATFHKAMPDAIKKGYLRIEMMRAMKIAKALYEAGITEDRISGTSMVFSSDSKEAAAANRKCTLTFEKIKPRLSLYEYHFGQKKDEKQQD